MSRPFSYNDENFTVINNILICHIKINKNVVAGKEIIEVPPEIYNRLLYYSNVARVLRDKINTTRSFSFAIGVKVIDNKYYLISSGNVDSDNYEYISCIYSLKDI